MFNFQNFFLKNPLYIVGEFFFFSVNEHILLNLDKNIVFACFILLTL